MLGVQIWKQGKAGVRIRPEIGDGRLKAMWRGKLHPVKKSEVKDLCDAWFFSALDVWHRWKTFGALPFGGGWAEQPAHLVEVIEHAESGYRSV